MTVGERSSFWESSSLALVRASRSSWRRRGTRTDHEVSRKNRLISPTTVGIANVGNSTPRSQSKRSIALIRPMVPTWTMSSIGSLRTAEAGRGVTHQREVELDEGVSDVGALGAVLVECGEPQEQGAGQGAGVDGLRGRKSLGSRKIRTWKVLRALKVLRGLENVGRGLALASVSTFELPCSTDMPPPWVADGRGGRSRREERSLHLNTGGGAAANAVLAECHMSATRCSDMST